MDLFDLSETVREARKRHKLTQSQLSSMSGVSRSRIAALETGAVFGMNLGSVLNILEALDLRLKVTDMNMGRPTFDDLMEEQEQDRYRRDEDAPGLGG